jgi:hypothetical protein
LAIILEHAVNGPNQQSIQVDYMVEKPELLRDIVQAIVSGELHSDGIFYAEYDRQPQEYRLSILHSNVNQK